MEMVACVGNGCGGESCCVEVGGCADVASSGAVRVIDGQRVAQVGEDVECLVSCVCVRKKV